jgi:hypothetical protein
MPQLKSSRSKRPGRMSATLAMGLTCAILGMAAAAPQRAFAGHCSGTLTPVPGQQDTGKYTFSCDTAVEDMYTVTAVSASGNLMAGTLHDPGQGFECFATTAEGTEPEEDEDLTESPEAEEEEVRSIWDCTEGAAAAHETIEGFFTAETNLCSAALTLQVTIYRQPGQAMRPVAQFGLPISCPASSGLGGQGVKPAPPVLRVLRISPSIFKGGGSAGGSGTRVSYRLSKSARVTFSLERQLPGVKRGTRCRGAAHPPRGIPPCKRSVSIPGELVRHSMAGLNSFRFTGRFAGHMLAAGTYRFLAAARSSTGQASHSVRSAWFRVRG